MYRVERLSIREISRRTGLHRKTVRRALSAETPPRYVRALTGSKVDPFKEWICDQLRADPRIASQRLRELAVEVGYAGGKTVFDDYVREVRRGSCRRGRSSGRSIGPGSWCSAICGSRGGTFRSVMVSCVAAGL